MTSPTPRLAPLLEYLPTCSGGAASLLPRAALDFEGRRMLGSAMRGLSTDPIRVYAGVAHGGAAERARLLAEELERLGAAERAWLVIGAPTGRGWVDHVLLRAMEALTHGDVAIACSQFGADRSVSSTAAIDLAAQSMLDVLRELLAHPALTRPQLVVVGASFGAWTLTRVLPEVAAAGPAALGFIGTPGVARLDQHTDELAALSAKGIRIVREERPDDPVVAFPGKHLGLAPSRRWKAADRGRWLPVVTLLRAARAIDAVSRFDRPTVLQSTPHDYRHRAPAVAAALLGVDDGERLARVESSVLRLEEEESTWLRSYGPEPVLAWPDAPPGLRDAEQG